MNNEKDNPFSNIFSSSNEIKEPLESQLTENTTQNSKKANNVSWFAVTDNFLKDIQDEHKQKLTATDLQMLAFMLQKMDYNNICEIPDQKKINEKLGISIRSISTAIKHLKEWNCITRDKRLTRTFMLNPYYFYRGGPGPQKNKKRQFTRFVNKNEQEKRKKKEKTNKKRS
ncbi:MAG: replication/maintenance protein RepL [Enterococcus sp.]|nr:replication/maintenance protein RepL [Enterococcus sp.]